jgi:hypothetical protein
MRKLLLVTFLVIAQSAYGGLAEFAEQWLGPGTYDADGDNVVTFLDFAAAADGFVLNYINDVNSVQVVVPNVVGITQTAATAAIINAGLTIGTITQQHDHAAPSGNIINQTPVDGTAVNTGSSVNLVVSLGEEVNVPPNYFVDPAMHDNSGNGLSQIAAKKTISAAMAIADDNSTIYLMPGTYDDSAASQGDAWYIQITEAKNLAIKPYDTNRITLTTDNTYGCVRVNAGNIATAKKTVAFENINFSFNAGNRFIYFDTDKQVCLRFENCDFDASKDRPLIYSASVSQDKIRDISFIRCTYVKGPVATYAIQIKDFATVTFDRCTLESGFQDLAYRLFEFGGRCQNIILTNNNITSTATAIYVNVKSFDRLLIMNNTFVHPRASGSVTNFSVSMSDQPFLDGSVSGYVNISDNTFRYPNTTSGVFQAIQLGTYMSNVPNTLERPIVSGNIIQCDRPGFYGTGIELNHNTHRAIITRNKISGFEFGLRLSASDCSIMRNAIYCTNGAHCMAACDNSFRSNTFVSVSGHAQGRPIVFGRLEFASAPDNTVYTNSSVQKRGNWDLSKALPEMLALVSASTTLDPDYWGTVTKIDDANDIVYVDKWVHISDGAIVPPPNAMPVSIVQFSERNIVVNNIIDGSRAEYTMTFDFNPRCGKEYIDYNCYRAGSHLLSNLGEATEFNLTQLQSKWATWSILFSTNDAHSIEADPQYRDLNNGDFTPLNPLILGGSEPDYLGNPSAIGAVYP